MHVDGVFLLSYSWEATEIYDKILDSLRFPDGSPMFHMKKEPACKVPTWQQTDVERSQTLEFRMHEWVNLQEWDVPDANFLADLVIKHGGLMLKGPAGTGKTKGVIGTRNLMTALMAKIPGKHLAMALRHCTAMLMCGKTIAHYLHKYRRRGGAPKAGTIVIIDEWSEVQLHTWIELAQWKLVGVIFIIVGDADGQRKPIFDRWQDAMDTKDIRRSQLIHELCGGLCVTLTVYRRGADQELFDMYTSLYARADDDSQVPGIVEHLRGIYPYPNKKKCDHFFVISHKKRMLLNHAMNWLVADDHTDIEFIPSFGEKPGMTMQPQDMIIWKGMQLLCYSRRYAKNSPVTGAVYDMEGWDGSRVTISLNDDYIGESLIVPPAEIAEEADEDDAASDAEALEDVGENAEDKGSTMEIRQVRRPDGTVVKKPVYRLSYKRASEILRPQFGLVYASIQGRTMKGSVALMDLDSPNMTVRDVITAMSRPTTGANLHFVTQRQQRDMFEGIENRLAHNEFDLRKRVAESKARPPSERPTPSRIGR